MTEASIIKTVCAHNGSMNHDDLLSKFSPFDEVIDRMVNKSESCAVVSVNGQKKVIIRTKVRLCRAQNCPGCENIHLCKLYLFGSCRFATGRRGCRFSHDVMSGQNASILSAHNLNTLDTRELCVVLLQSDHTLLPAVCHSYNNGTGQYGRCQDGENCRRLHICEKYLCGPCECPRAHDFYEPHPLKTLQDRGLPTELMAIIKEIYSNIQALKNQSRYTNTAGQNNRRGPNTQNRRPSSTVTAGRPFQTSIEKTEICMFYIKGHCIHGDFCRKEHSSVPYKWEFKEGSEWTALPDNEAIEKDYCNPANTYSSGICFDTMSRGLESVRRLSTVPSVIQPTYILTTEWLWYWENEFGNWIQYATAEVGQRLSSITSEELEQKYQTDSGAVLEFTAGSQTYQLSFADMIQTNKRYGTKRLVRRRPKFVSAAEVQTIKTTKRAPSNFKSLPTHWNKALTPDAGYKRVSLQTSDGECSAIKRLFTTTMSGFNILQIERIQNKALWEVFQWQMDLMKKNNGGRDVAEKQLFHGTDPKHVDAICLNNFDWRICGTHGTAYGKGSYFASDASYSHGYTKDSGTRSMFVCRVLVGDYTTGHSSYLRPPSKDGGDTIFYDSCVNDVFNPSIFVVFEKHQIYPEYLIQYQDAIQSHPYLPAAVTTPRPASAPVRRPASVSVHSVNPSTRVTPVYPSYSNPPAAVATPRPAPALVRRPASVSVHSVNPSTRVTPVYPSYSNPLPSSVTSSRASSLSSSSLHSFQSRPKSSKSDCLIS